MRQTYTIIDWIKTFLTVLRPSDKADCRDFQKDKPKSDETDRHNN